jgi:hypothetical protein
MNSLLRFINSKERAKRLLSICKRKRLFITHFALTHELVENGFYINNHGKCISLDFLLNFQETWSIVDSSTDNSLYTDIKVWISDSIPSETSKLIRHYLERREALVTSDLCSDCDLVVIPYRNGDGSTEEVDSLCKAMWEGEFRPLIIFEEELPSSARIKFFSKSTPKRLSAAPKKVWDQLSQRDYSVIQQALDDLKGKDSIIDAILDGVSVNNCTGALIRGSRFKGTSPAMEYLDVALMGLLSIAGPASRAIKIRENVRRLRLNVRMLPILDGFASLEDLEITLAISRNEPDYPKARFDLSSFGSMPSLKRLSISHEIVGKCVTLLYPRPRKDIDKSDYVLFEDLISRQEHLNRRIGSYGLGTLPNRHSNDHCFPSLLIDSLDGLDAPNLEYLNLPALGLRNIKALAKCKRLIRVDLSDNYSLVNLSPLLASSHGIQHLDLARTGICDASILSHFSSLGFLSLADTKLATSLDSVNGGLGRLRIFHLQRSNVTSLSGLSSAYSLSWINLYSCRDLASISGLRTAELESLILTDVGIRNLEGIGELTCLKELQIMECSHLISLLRSAERAANPVPDNSSRIVEDDKPFVNASLENLSIDSCPQLADISQLENLSCLKALNISCCDLIEDASPIGKVSSLSNVRLFSCPRLSKLPKKWPPYLSELAINGAAIVSLGQLPNTLKELELMNNRSLQSLTGLENCRSLKTIGRSSACLDFSGCTALTSLNGLKLDALESITIPSSITNLDILRSYPNVRVTIAVDFRGDDATSQGDALPAALVDALLTLPPLHLALTTRKIIVSLYELRRLPMISLDLRRCYFEDLGSLFALSIAEELRVEPRSEISKKLGAATFKGTELEMLKLRFMAGEF